MVGLGRPPGDTQGAAAAVSADGALVFGTTGHEAPPGALFPESDAFRWTAQTGLVPLGLVADASSTVFSVGGGTADGSVIVGSTWMPDSEGQPRFFAFIWDAANGMRLLEDVLETDFGLDLTGRQLAMATGITPDGLAIVGTGDFFDGTRPHFVVRFDRQCRDGADNDGDGLVDLDDSGCTDASDTSEHSSALVCDNGFDDDHDGLADGADPGCSSAADPSEHDPAIHCDDGIDNDGDGLVDVADPGCESVADASEIGACENGIDDDGDGFVDVDDPGCTNAADGSEQSTDFACDDGLDDDGDGLVDMADPGCPFPYASPENPPCDDGLDNDGNGFVDFADSKCTSYWPYWEEPPSASAFHSPACGVGAELALVMPAIAWLSARRRVRG
jgi:hypothetical protein